MQDEARAHRDAKEQWLRKHHYLVSFILSYLHTYQFFLSALLVFMYIDVSGNRCQTLAIIAFSAS